MKSRFDVISTVATSPVKRTGVEYNPESHAITVTFTAVSGNAFSVEMDLLQWDSLEHDVRRVQIGD